MCIRDSDYTYLYDVSGLDPRPFALRRWLATQAYYAVAWRLFDSHVLLWHLKAFLVHMANAVWVYLLALRFGVGRNASWIAAGLFAASPIAFTVLYLSLIHISEPTRLLSISYAV